MRWPGPSWTWGTASQGLDAGPARVLGHQIRRLRLAGRGSRRRRHPAARPPQLRAGCRDPRQLRDGVGRHGRLREPASRRARADPLRRRRRRDRGDADRKALGHRGVRHRIARQARPHNRARRRPRAGLHDPRLGPRPAEVRPHHGRRRRQELPPQLRAAAPRRAPGALRRRARSSPARAATCRLPCARWRRCRASTWSSR